MLSPMLRLQRNKTPLNFELSRIQLLNIRTLGNSIKHILRHKLACARAVLDAPARVTCGNKQARDARPADQRTALLSKPYMSWEVTCLLGFDRCSGQDGTECADVGDYVVALSFVTFYLVCCVGERYICIWLTYGMSELLHQ